MKNHHSSVLLTETIKELNIQKNGKYIDATFGLGGHSNMIALNGGEVLGIDLDKNVLENLSPNKNTSVKVVLGNFKDIEKLAQDNDFSEVDGVLFDLGLSMLQIASSKRGFSFQKDEEILDMRISPDTQKNTASHVLKQYTSDELVSLFVDYSQVLKTDKLVHSIKDLVKKISRELTVGDLKKICKSIYGSSYQSEIRKIMQALRIEVNSEFENLSMGINGALKVLSPKGRILVISFHPTEDRWVKKITQNLSLEEIYKKPIKAKNDKSYEHSAKLRVYQKI